MNFELTDDQQAIKRTARDFLAARYRPERIRELADAPRGFSDEEWTAIAELGWPGVLVPERHGGLGLGAIELVVLAEELGYALAPTPLLPSIWAGLLLAALGSEEQRERWLPALASGEARGTVAIWQDGAGPAPDGSRLALGDGPPQVEGGRLSGRMIAVPELPAADFVIVSGGGSRHFLIKNGTPGVSATPQPALDQTRKLYELALDEAGAEPLAGGAQGESGGGDPDTGAASAAALAQGLILASLAGESVGVAQRTMEMAVAYAKDRRQFGRPIGAYQAISHRCAQMLLEVESARSLTYGAAWALDHDPHSAPRAAAMAKAYAGDAGWRVSASALQVHGGIGFTWEHDLHFFLKRAKANAHAFGDSAWHRERVVALAGV
jgi:alkylation response protein AidB-like acyl-CoA dehydrogenase